MRYRIVPDQNEVVTKLSVGQRGVIWSFAFHFYPDILTAANEADRLNRVWKILWHVILDDAENTLSWAKVLKAYRTNGVLIPQN